jgi:APA family basic amino acid/polyamine antiporter
LIFIKGNASDQPAASVPSSTGLIGIIGAAMIPVLFAYGGWHTSSFIAGELKDPRKNLPKGLLFGISGVIVIYVLVAYVCIYALGLTGLQNTRTPASAVMKLALGDTGAKIIAIGIAISTFGFLSQSMLTTPRMYYVMAQDGLFFKSVAYLHPRTKVPVVAIILQGCMAMVIAVSGTYEQILNYVVSMDFLFMVLTASCLFVFRYRDKQSASVEKLQFQVPGHPWTTLFFIAAGTFVVLNVFIKYPENSLIGLFIAIAGFPVYLLWRKRISKTKT